MIEPKLKYKGNYKLENFKQVNYLPGLDLVVKGNANLLYRFDGPVDSIPIHIISVLEEFGFEVRNKRKLKKLSNLTGHCRNLVINSKNPIKISVPFYEPYFQEADIFNMGHEDMHAIQHLQLGDAIGILEKRFLEQGYNINFIKVKDEEKQANLVGLLRIIEEKRDPIKLLCFPKIEKTYQELERYKI